MFILSIVPLPLERSFRSGGRADDNPTNRLSEIRSKLIAVEARIRDLEALLTELILTPGADLEPVSFATYDIPDETQPDGTRTTSDASTVRQQLYAARAFEGELRTAEQFWNQVVQANKEAEKDTHDHFKRG